MRKLMIWAILFLIAVSAQAFDKGTKNITGLINFTSYKPYEDAETDVLFGINSQIGYFVTKNLSLDLGFDFDLKQVNYQGSDYDRGSRYYSETTIGFGLGARYFPNDRVYLGGSFSRKMYITDEDNINAAYYNLCAGLLIPVAENVYFNIGGIYMAGLGSYSDSSSGRNEESGFNVAAGFSIFLKKK